MDTTARDLLTRARAELELWMPVLEVHGTTEGDAHRVAALLGEIDAALRLPATVLFRSVPVGAKFVIPSRALHGYYVKTSELTAGTVDHAIWPGDDLPCVIVSADAAKL